MDRTSAREVAAATLESLGSFAAVVQGAPDHFGGQSPIAVVTSRSLRLDSIARKLYTIENTITVSIYVRRDSSAAAEDELDTLSEAAAIALHATGTFIVEESNADPASGAQRLVDGLIYRVERIPLTVLEEGGTDA